MASLNIIRGQAVQRLPEAWRDTLIWLAPLVLLIITAKLLKLAMWMPSLPPDVMLGEGVHKDAASLVRAALGSASPRIIAALALIDLVRRIFFPRSKAIWTLVAAAAAFATMRLISGIRSGTWSLSDSWLWSHGLSELHFGFTLFRADLQLLVALAWIGLAWRLLGGRPLRHGWPLWLLTVPVLVLGLDLAYFRKTGLSGTGEILGFVLKDTQGMRALARSELDVTSAICIAAPLATLALVPRFLTRAWPAKVPGTFGIHVPWLLATGTALVLALDPLRLPPVYARHTDDTLVRVGSDVARKLLASVGSARGHDLIGAQAFDYRIETSDTGKPKRNVVIVMLESIRASSTGLLDATLSNTPFLLELAREGARVDHMYAVAPRTSAAWVSIFNGIHPGDADSLFLWGRMEAAQPAASSLPQVLRRHGYRTGFFLPTHLRLQNDEQLAKNLRFDDLVFLQSDANATPLPTPGFDTEAFEMVNHFGLEDRVLLKPIENWVHSNTRSGVPMLLAVMTNVGHYPYTPPKTWPRAILATPAGGEYDSYLNSIAYVDAYLKDLFAIFRKAGLLKSTVFIVLGDHGESFGEHGPRQHLGQAYETVLHVPAVIYAEGLVRPGSTVSGLRQQIDVFPTVLDALGLEVTQGMLPGRSLLRPVPQDRRLYFSGVYEESTLGLRQGHTKFLYNYGRIPSEFYDLSDDPAERTDRGRELPAERAAGFEADLLRWHESVRRSLLSPHRER